MQLAIIRDGAQVLEMPWSGTHFKEVAHLEAGKTYEVTVRDEDMVDLNRLMVFVSDRVHKSHDARVLDSEYYPLLQIREGSRVVYDEAICEVHHTRMELVKAEVGHGLYVPESKADAFCDKEYPHHADWIRGGCVVGDVKTAPHYVCSECVAATAKYKRDHPNDAKQSFYSSEK